MKRLKFHRAIVAIAMMLIGWLPSFAHDFEVNGIFYNKTSDNTVAVTFKGYDYSYSDEYLGNVVIPSSVNYNGTTYSVTSIGERAFSSCIGLTSIEIPNSVTSLGDYAFSWCDSLTSIVVDAGNSKYDSRNDCNAIIETASNTLIAGCQNTIIPNSVTSIGDYAFADCSGLTSIEIPNSVISIGECAFEGCESLKYVELGQTVEYIGFGAFCECGYTSITIPSSVIYIGDEAFVDCWNLISIKVDDQNKVYDSRENCNAIIETATNVLIAGCINTKIPNTVTTIGQYAFVCCDIVSISIPNSVESIEESAFEECNLASISIPNSVVYIGKFAFSYCKNLYSIEIGESVNFIGDEAFYGCDRLSKIYCKSITPPVCQTNTVFEETAYEGILYVPINCKNKYESTDPWQNFICILEKEFESSVDGIDKNNLIVSTNDSKIIVENILMNGIVNIYSIDGVLVKSVTATDGNVVVEVPAKGIYVVVVDDKSFKVMVK